VKINPNAITYILGMTAVAAGLTMSPQHAAMAAGASMLLSALEHLRNEPLNLGLFSAAVAVIIHGSLQPGGFFS
jgi:hypothetical protein